MSVIAAAAPGYDLALVLGSLLVIIVAARLAAEVAERINIPPVLGEIMAGIAIGPSVLGWVDPISHLAVADMVLLLGEIGVILLLLQVGLEMDLTELGRVGRSALLVAIIGVALPFAAGFGVASAFGETGKIALFIGATLTATSVGITARVLGDLRALATTEARIVLGAAVADDVLGLVILTVVVKIVTEGSIGAGVVFETIGLALGFLIITGLLAIFVIPKVLDRIHRISVSSTTVVGSAFALTIAFALLAHEAKLAFIIGAFMAGLGIGRSAQHARIADGLGPLGHVFIPVFFASIGINADLSAMVKPQVLALAAVLTVVAIIGKLISAAGVTEPGVDRLMVGIGMIPRGEVGLIFASIGLSRGVLNEDLYGAVLIMVLVTTVITPPLITRRLKKNTIGDLAPASDSDISTPSAVEPRGGWLQVHDSSIILNGVPAPQQTVTLALRAAELATTAEPSHELIRWFGESSQIPLIWTAADSEQLLDLLRDGSPKSWRFLETTGVLERCLPEVATTISQRRSDPDSFDPFHPLRLPTVDRLHVLVASPGLDPIFDDRRSTLERPRLLTTCAFLIDGSHQSDDRLSLARRISPRDVEIIDQVITLSDDMITALRGPDTTPPARSFDGSVAQQVVDLAYLLSVVRFAGDSRLRPVLDLNVVRNPRLEV
jgi:Kef-type K+ transport system membrane component KefB